MSEEHSDNVDNVDEVGTFEKSSDKRGSEGDAVPFPPLSKTQKAYLKWTKPYKQAHPEKVREWNAKMYAKHKDKYLARMKEKVKCEICDIEVARSVMYRHVKTKAHVDKAGGVFVEPTGYTKAKEMVKCNECGMEVQRGNMARHRASSRCHKGG